MATCGSGAKIGTVLVVTAIMWLWGPNDTAGREARRVLSAAEVSIVLRLIADPLGGPAIGPHTNRKAPAFASCYRAVGPNRRIDIRVPDQESRAKGKY